MFNGGFVMVEKQEKERQRKRTGLFDIVGSAFKGQDVAQDNLSGKLTKLRELPITYYSGATPSDAYLYMVNHIISNMLRFAESKTLGKSSSDSYRIPLFVGPPGTGKTFFAEKVISEAHKIVSSLLEKPDPKDREYNQKVYQKLTNILEVPEIFKEFVLEHGKALEQIIEFGKDSPVNLELLLMTLMNAIEQKEALGQTLKNMVENEDGTVKKGIVNVVVFPSQENATDFISNIGYVVGGEEVLQQTTASPILSDIKNAWEGKNILLVVDEFTETLKKDTDKRAKALHDFIDDYRRGYITIKKPTTDKDKQILNDLFDILKQLHMYDKVVDQEMQYKIPLPATFHVISTGNIRKPTSPIGHTESTEERIKRYNFSYPDKNKFNNFVDDQIRIYKSAIPESDYGYMEELATQIKETYGELLDGFSKTGKVLLPSYRTVEGIMRAYAGYLIIRNDLTAVMGNYAKTFELEMINDIDGAATLDIKQTKFMAPEPEDMLKYLIIMLNTMQAFNVGDFQTISEDRSSIKVEYEINNLFTSESQKESLLSSDELEKSRIHIIDIDSKQYIYSKTYVLHLMYMASAMLSGQKFFLLSGKTQEGKSTMVSDISPKIIGDLVKMGVLDGINDVMYVPFNNNGNVENELTLETPNVRSKGNGPLSEPYLVKVIKDASANPDTLYVLVVNEIDSLPFTQGLNQVFTRKNVTINGKEYNIKNLVVVGTTNISNQITDNFLSRSIFPLLMTREIGTFGASMDDMNGRTLLSLYASVNRIRENYVHDLDVSYVVNHILEYMKGKNKRIGFYEVSTIVNGVVENYIESGILQKMAKVSNKSIQQLLVSRIEMHMDDYLQRTR